MTTACPFDKDILNRTTSVISKFIKEKEIKLRQTQDELNSIPPMYVVAGVIEKEANIISEEIDSMKKLIIDLKRCSDSE